MMLCDINDIMHLILSQLLHLMFPHIIYFTNLIQIPAAEDKGPRDVADMVSGLKLEQVQPHFSAHATSILCR